LRPTAHGYGLCENGEDDHRWPISVGDPKPSQPRDLHAHNCIRFRLPWDGSIQPWIFDKGRQHTEIAVEGSLTVNDLELLLSAALDGVGIAYFAEPMIGALLAEGRLVTLLEGWSSTLSGIFLYHPSRQPPMPLQVFLSFIERWRKHKLMAIRAKSPSTRAPPTAA
jgi:DNA-binding transcriptional LysR family regulator